MANAFHTLTISDVAPLTRDSVCLTFTATDAADFNFHAGQYLSVRMMVDGEEVRRSYSICSSEQDGRLSVGVKKVSGGVFSTWANDCATAGMTLEVMPPQGHFGDLPAVPAHTLASGPRYLGVAAGSGITPVISILRTRLAREPDARFTLIYGNRSSSSIMFREALEDLKNEFLERLSLVHILSREQQDIDLFNGRIDTDKCAALFRQWVPVNELAGAFVCGPLQMMEAVRDVLVAHGVLRERVRVELFAADEAAARERVVARRALAQDSVAGTVRMKLDGLEREFEIQTQAETILDAGLRAGYELPYSCKGGVCSTCMARLVEGEVDMDANYALEDYELARGFILCCQSYPVTRDIVIDYDQ
jgi:ring-1,2-phenylacetyl-CoA epoxidase subunit PaaE